MKHRVLFAALFIAFLNLGQAQESGEMPAELEVSLDRAAAERGSCYHISGTILLRLPDADDSFVIEGKMRPSWRPDPVYGECSFNPHFMAFQIIGKRNHSQLILSFSLAREDFRPACSTDRFIETTDKSKVNCGILKSTEFTLLVADGSNDEHAIEDSSRLGNLTGKLTLHLACPMRLVVGESVPVISVLPTNTSPWPLLFDDSKTSAELSALAARSSDVVGLTRPSKPYPPTGFFRAASKPAALRQGVCFWVESIRLEFTPVQVLLTSEYPRGSCEYRTTREHEMLHYRDMQILFIRYQALVVAALRQAGFPTAEQPVFVGSVMEGKSQITRQLENTLQPIYALMDQALQADADRRDAPEERVLTWSKCTNWYARSTGVRPNASGTHPVPEETASKLTSQHNQ